MFPCDATMYTCGNTRTATVSMYDSFTINQVANLQLTLTCGTKTLELNSRTREFNYQHTDSTTRSNFKYVWNTSYWAECFDSVTTRDSSFKDTYNIVDITLHYVDPRYDLIVYTKESQSFSIDKAISESISSGVTACRKTVDLSFGAGGTAIRFPYIQEVVPITKTIQILCSLSDTPLYEEVINSAYSEGVRVLMPTFMGGLTGGTPLGFFCQNDTTYDATKVDWYVQGYSMEADGDPWLWWPAWNQAVGVHNEVDAHAAEVMYQVYAGNYNAPRTENITTPAQYDVFMGSAAVDVTSNVFLSAQFDDGRIVLNKLWVQGVDTTIPQYNEANVWYPIAPI